MINRAKIQKAAISEQRTVAQDANCCSGGKSKTGPHTVSVCSVEGLQAVGQSGASREELAQSLSGGVKTGCSGKLRQLLLTGHRVPKERRVCKVATSVVLNVWVATSVGSSIRYLQYES